MSHGETRACPRCGEECWRDSADVGVGIIWGPWGCPGCGWSENDEYDLTAGRDPIDERGGVLDQFGNYYPPGNTVALAYRLARRIEMEQHRDDAPRHVAVYGEPGMYAGWPANHGAWQWGDEMLVGFMRGPWKRRGMHNITEPFQKVLARSLDGGETWALEVPNVDFEAAGPTVPEVPSGDYILRLCGGYDHGGEYCDRHGGYYWSIDRGRTWVGPRLLFLQLRSGLHATTRTCVLGDLVFTSIANQEHWGSDCVQCVRLEEGVLSFVGEVLNDGYRAVMPAAATHRYGTCSAPNIERIVVCMRRRGMGPRGCWIDSVFSEDGGVTWSDPVHVADTGQHNGNPPALIVGADGALYCAYGNRDDCAIWVSRSIDGGGSWRQHALLRQGECSDIGYPRLFRRVDGRLVCVYYWSDAGEPQRIEATVFT